MSGARAAFKMLISIVGHNADLVADPHQVVEAGDHIVHVGRVTLAAGAAGGECLGAFGVVAVFRDGRSDYEVFSFCSSRVEIVTRSIT